MEFFLDTESDPEDAGSGLYFARNPRIAIIFPKNPGDRDLFFGVSRNPENSRSFRDSDSFGILGIRNFCSRDFHPRHPGFYALSGFYSRASRFFFIFGISREFLAMIGMFSLDWISRQKTSSDLRLYKNSEIVVTQG